jgi:repressor LexA
MQNRPLTERQREVLGAINYSIAKRGYPPTIRELADGLGVTSTNGVSELLDALERKGVIQRDIGVARGIRVIAKAEVAATEQEDARG